MSFRLWTIFYVFALLAAALATFGPWGIAAAACVLGFWAWVFYAPKRQFTLAILLYSIVAFALLLAMYLPAVGSSRQPPLRSWCMSQLKQIAYALLNYESVHGTLPPAYITDANGKQMLSWRVSILPYLDFDQPQPFDLTKPWDDPVNHPFSARPIDLFQCPSHSAPSFNTTDYFAIVGPQTVLPVTTGRLLSEIKDGADSTIVLIEWPNHSVRWAEPRDLSFDEAVELLTSPIAAGDGHHIDNGFFYKPSFGRTVAFANGDVAFLSTPLHRKLAIALLTVAGGETIDRAALQRATQPELDYAKCYVFGLFVFLALLPAAWLGRQHASPRSGEGA